MGRSDPLTRRSLLAVAGVALLAGGCASTSPSVVDSEPTTDPSRTAVPRPSESMPPGPAREGTRAPSQVDRYRPVALVLPGKERADVVPVSTEDGELKVPSHVDHLGWWDGSAWLGDPFGATVIAGHVDSATEGLGFFARLLDITKGQRVVLVGSKGQRQTYQVTSVRTVAKNALADDGESLSQTGDHRLVLITCTGPYTPGRGYAQNLVVTARQVDAARK